MVCDYYGILGVDWDATLDQIKSAYRSKAKQLHPDRYAGGSESFRDVQEAYEVLCDPVRRKEYDANLALVNRAGPGSRNASHGPLRSGRCPVEPLVPADGPNRSSQTLFDQAFGSLLLEVFGQEWLDMGLSGWPEMDSTPTLQVEVDLTRQQACRGGRIRISVPVQVRCPT